MSQPSTPGLATPIFSRELLADLSKLHTEGRHCFDYSDQETNLSLL